MISFVFLCSWKSTIQEVIHILEELVSGLFITLPTVYYVTRESRPFKDSVTTAYTDISSPLLNPSSS